MRGKESRQALLHVYGQDTPHECLVVVGNRTGLNRLAQALISGEVNGADCADGEYFDIIVIETDKPTLETIPLPYTDEAFATPDMPEKQRALQALIAAEFSPKTEPNGEE